MKNSRNETVVAPPGEYETAIRSLVAMQDNWKVRILPPLISEPGSITVTIHDVELKCRIPRDGIIDDNHWASIWETALIFAELVDGEMST